MGFGSAGYILLSFPSVCRRLRGSPDTIRRHKGSRRGEGLGLEGFASELASREAHPLVAVAGPYRSARTGSWATNPRWFQAKLVFSRVKPFAIQLLLRGQAWHHDLGPIEISADLLPAIIIN